MALKRSAEFGVVSLTTDTNLLLLSFTLNDGISIDTGFTSSAVS